jgi:hypothetical protein
MSSLKLDRLEQVLISLLDNKKSKEIEAPNMILEQVMWTNGLQQNSHDKGILTLCLSSLPVSEIQRELTQ